VRTKAEWFCDASAAWSAATFAGPVHRLASTVGGRPPSGVRSQPLSRRPATGGVEILAVFEDLERHHAADKVVGFPLERDLLGRADVLAVSGRISFGIAQKCARAGLSGQPAFGLGEILGLSARQDATRGLLGELDSKLDSKEDRAWLRSLMAYLHERDIGWIWWSWNPNSEDTGRILKDDWVTVNEHKMDFLREALRRSSWTE
jgi:hypothetical protein